MENTEFKFDKANREQQMAFNLVAKTNACLFINGKAGTGKTTFIKWIQSEIKKNFLVLAPTGIAALNAGGQTLHSFFGFPMEVISPGTELDVSFEKRRLLEHTDTIIVDEASMVRCDLVDGMDRILRKLTHSHSPFGGKQVVFVGDLFQLSPVVRWETGDGEILNKLYGAGAPYFYKAHVIKRMNLPKIEFLKVYRQKDKAFLEILDRMRMGENTSEDLEILNQHVRGCDDMEDFSITLTAYNNIADHINELKLGELESDEYCYLGSMSGEFKPQDSPVPLKLKLKAGAQVIFCRNDYSHGLVNGTIAKVKDLADDKIIVTLKDGKELAVEQMVWEKRKSVYDEKTKKVRSEVVGSFTQYPLKLAWAITINKSQGMTFDRMHFDLTRGPFAPGQAYVAISRMRTLDGLTLSNKIMAHHIMQNCEIRAYSNSFNNVTMIEDELSAGKRLYKHLTTNDYDGAVKVCMKEMVRKIKGGDYRNAALVAKRMFDVMLDDKCLKGMTKNVELLKDCTMTCNFLNAIICLYNERYEEAIGYADMVLDRKICLEAMFVKGKALLALGQYEDADEMAKKIRKACEDSDDKVVIDKKQYLLETEINQRLGTPNIETCQHLVKLCPEYTPTYLMIRDMAIENNIKLETEEEEQNELVVLFNDTTVDNDTFKEKLDQSNKNSYDFQFFCKKVKNVKIESKQAVAA